MLETILTHWPQLIVTLFLWEPLAEIRKIAPGIRVGFLCDREDQALVDDMKSVGFYQYCSDGGTVSEEAMRRDFPFVHGVSATRLS